MRGFVYPHPENIFLAIRRTPESVSLLPGYEPVSYAMRARRGLLEHIRW